MILILFREKFWPVCQFTLDKKSYLSHNRIYRAQVFFMCSLYFFFFAKGARIKTNSLTITELSVNSLLILNRLEGTVYLEFRIENNRSVNNRSVLISQNVHKLKDRPLSYEFVIWVYFKKSIKTVFQLRKIAVS